MSKLMDEKINDFKRDLSDKIELSNHYSGLLKKYEENIVELKILIADLESIRELRTTTI